MLTIKVIAPKLPPRDLYGSGASYAVADHKELKFIIYYNEVITGIDKLNEIEFGQINVINENHEFDLDSNNIIYTEISTQENDYTTYIRYNPSTLKEIDTPVKFRRILHVSTGRMAFSYFPRSWNNLTVEVDLKILAKYK